MDRRRRRRMDAFWLNVRRDQRRTYRIRRRTAWVHGRRTAGRRIQRSHGGRGRVDARGAAATNGNSSLLVTAAANRTRRLAVEQLPPLLRYRSKKVLVDLGAEHGTFHVAGLVEGAQRLPGDEVSVESHGGVIEARPAVEVLETRHPLIGIKQGDCGQMIRHGADFFSEKHRHGRHGLLDIDAVALQLFDALGKELVVMDQGP
jgi:hypothetical protein